MDEPRTFSYSKLQSWQRCKYKYGLSYLDEWTRKSKSSYLELGSLIHELLEDWYLTGEDHSAMFTMKWMDAPDVSSQTLQAVSTAIWLYGMYINYAPTALDTGLKTKQVEWYFKVPLVTPKGRDYFLEGYIDAIMEDISGNLWIMEHKSSGRFWNATQVLMDPQLGFYAGALQQNNIPVFGIILNQLKTYAYKDRSKVLASDLFKRERTYRTPTELRNIVLGVGSSVDDLLEHEEERTRSLSRDCDRCDFNEVCLYGLKGIDPSMLLEINFKKKEDRPETVALDFVSSSVGEKGGDEIRVF